MIKTHMASIKEDIKDIKAKQDVIEVKVVESESRMEKKYDEVVSKMGDLEKKVQEMEERQRRKETEDSSKNWPDVHPGGSKQYSGQPALQPAGRVQLSSQPTSQTTGTKQIVQSKDDKETYSLVRKARRTLGFSPITGNDIKEVMDELKVDNLEEGMEEVVKDYFRAEMAMPQDVINQLKFTRIFHRAGESRSEDNQLFVEFSEDSMPSVVYKFVRKMRKECNILAYIPDAFRERAAELERVAFQLRHSTPSYNTKIRWGWGDLLLERKLRGSKEQYRSVSVTDLPPVDLTAIPRERMPMATHTASPAPGRMARRKRARSQESPNLSQSDF